MRESCGGSVFVMIEEGVKISFAGSDLVDGRKTLGNRCVQSSASSRDEGRDVLGGWFGNRGQAQR